MDRISPSIDDASMHTVTASSVHALPHVHHNNGEREAYERRPQTSYSDTGFSRTYDRASTENTPESRYQSFANSPANEYPAQPMPSSIPPNVPRPSSHSRPSSQQAQNPQPQQHTSSGAEKNVAQSTQSASNGGSKKADSSVVIKVGMVGDAQIGKTSLMVKYVEGSWDEDYIQTLGVNFMEKSILLRNTEITFSIWDLGGQREFVNMLPLVCNDAVAILFMFDLTRKSTLNSVKEWYRQGRGFNKSAIPFLVGTKYDFFVGLGREEQEEVVAQAKRFAKAMKASLIFSSTSHSINVQKIFKIVLSKAFDLRCTIPEIENVGEPLLLYQNVG
ncbi:Ras GTPase tem1 [Elasticomyces elasticus]|nr:Ras GTPase tem1 [Elasticomyces elasticus]